MKTAFFGSLALAFSALFNPCFGASLILDKGNGQTVVYPLSGARDVSVAPVTGNVTVRPLAAAGVAGDGWCPAAAPAVTFTVSPSSVTTGSATTATWSTVNATSCSGSGSTLPGSVPAWSSSLATANGGLSLTLPTTGTYTFRLSCTGPGGTTTVDRTASATSTAPLPTVNFTVSPATVATGGATTAVWSTANATTCSGSGSTLPGSVPAWGASLATSHIGLSLTLPTAGTYSFKLACTGPGGTTSVTRSATAGAVSAPTVNFTVSPIGIALGSTTTAVWSTTNATSCSSSGSTLPGTVSGWNTSLPTSNAGLSLTPTVEGAYTFRLSCTGAGGTTTVDRPVAVGPSVPAGCETAAMAGKVRRTSFVNSGNIRGEGNSEFPSGTIIPITNYSPLWGGTVAVPKFPSRNGTGGLPLLTGEYAAMEFNTGSSTATGTPWGGLNYGGLLWASSQQNSGGNAMVAISECPGDFSRRLPAATGCMSSGVGSSVNFSIGTLSTRCPLALNKTYYLNIGFFNTQGTDTCGLPLCHFFGQPN